MLNRYFLYSLLLVALLVQAPSRAHAENAAQDAKIIYKSLSYVRGLDIKSDDAQTLAVLYDATHQGSLKNAQEISDLLQEQGANDDVRLVPVQELETAHDADILVVGHFLETHFQRIRDISQAHGIFTISTDKGCAEQDVCSIAVHSKPSVKIYLNETALEDTGFDVDSTFRYLAIRL